MVWPELMTRECSFDVVAKGGGRGSAIIRTISATSAVGQLHHSDLPQSESAHPRKAPATENVANCWFARKLIFASATPTARMKTILQRRHAPRDEIHARGKHH